MFDFFVDVNLRINNGLTFFSQGQLRKHLLMELLSNTSV